MEKLISSSNLKTVIKGVADAIDNRLDGKSFKYLTTAEFEELSSEEKNRDDIVYQITDAELSFEDIVDVPDFATKEYVDQHGFSGDYNDLTDKPCYEMETISTKNIIFSGNKEDTIDVAQGSAENVNFEFRKISNQVIPKDDIVGASIVSLDEQFVITEEDLHTETDFQEFYFYPVLAEEPFSILFVVNDMLYNGTIPLSPGLWVMYSEYTHDPKAFTLTYNETASELKQLDEKFIPDTIARTDHIHDYNDLTNRPCYEESSRAKRYSYNSLTDTNLERLDIYEQDGIINALLKISDDNVSFEEVNGKTIIYDGVKKTINESNVTFIDSSSPNSNILSGSCFSFNNEMLIFVNDPVVFSHSSPSGVNSYPTGIWLSAKIDSDGNVSATPFILEYISENIVKQLDEKFIPDTIARFEDLPCYDTRIGEDIVITFSGDHTEYESIEMDANISYIKLSDEIITEDGVVGAVVDYGVSQHVISKDDIKTFEEMDDPSFISGKGIFDTTLFVFFIEEEIVLQGMPSFPPGVWAMVQESTCFLPACTITVKSSEGELKQLDEKFIPNIIARTDNLDYNILKNKPFYDTRNSGIITFSGNRDDYENINIEGLYFIKLTDQVIRINEISSVHVDTDVAGHDYNFTKEELTIIDMSQQGFTNQKGIMYTANELKMLVFVEKDVVMPMGIGIISAGVWTIAESAISPSFVATFESEVGELKQLEEKFIPDTIARTSDIPSIVVLTQEEYDALEAAGTINPDTYYLINEEK